MQRSIICIPAARLEPLGWMRSIVMVLLMSVPWLANAQAVLSPTTPSVVLGNTLQFTATVAGNPTPNLTWWVNGQEGGNPTFGRITQGSCPK